jgi:hypothetical protein
MRIAIIVWGSLYWEPRKLTFTGEWYFDGPPLPIEFSRISSGNRLTLIIKPGYDDVTTLYCISTLQTLDAACENLREREDTPNVENIGFLNFIDNTFRVRNSNSFILDILRRWNVDKNFHAVIWSDFGAKFTDVLHRPFSIDNAISFLEGLTDPERNSSLTYIRLAPPQIQTRFRHLILQHFKVLP